MSSQRGNEQTPYNAKRFTFTLSVDAEVTINLSSSRDTYLYLLWGHGTDGRARARNDDAGRTTLDSHLSLDLTAGDYTIEATTYRARKAGSFTLTVATDIDEATPCGKGEVRLWNGSCSPAGQRVYEFTMGTIVATRDIARTVQGGKPSACSLTVNKLTALMLAVPVHELRRTSPSPMFLGRSDNLEQNKNNKWLYSRATIEHERRAHWHAGVGLWQLDIWGPAQTLNHAERADIRQGGVGVAEHLRDMFCAYNGKRDWAEKVYRPWFGCKDYSNEDNKSNRDLCEVTHRRILDEKGDSLWVSATAGVESDGGVQDRYCVWSNKKPPVSESGFGCFLYDPARHEGNMDVANVDGTDSATKPNGFTPLAVAFISLTNPDGINSGTKYAVFPAVSTGYAQTLIKAVPKNKYSRSSRVGPNKNGWYVSNVGGRSLYVREGSDEECGTSGSATVAVCEWVRM